MTPAREQLLRWFTPERLARIFSQVREVRTDAHRLFPDCWVWTRRLNDGGYAELTTVIDGKRCTVLLHRVLYVWYFGDIIEETKIRHCQCGNRACINPWHLHAGDEEDNAKDAARDRTIGRRRRRMTMTEFLRDSSQDGGAVI